MAEILKVGPSPDQPGHTRFVLDGGYEGKVTARVTGLMFPPEAVGDGREIPARPVETVSVHLHGQHELVLAGTILEVRFDDGTTWAPPAVPPTGGTL